LDKKIFPDKISISEFILALMYNIGEFLYKIENYDEKKLFQI